MKKLVVLLIVSLVLVHSAEHLFSHFTHWFDIDIFWNDQPIGPFVGILLAVLGVLCALALGFFWPSVCLACCRWFLSLL